MSPAVINARAAADVAEHLASHGAKVLSIYGHATGAFVHVYTAPTGIPMPAITERPVNGRTCYQIKISGVSVEWYSEVKP